MRTTTDAIGHRMQLPQHKDTTSGTPKVGECWTLGNDRAVVIISAVRPDYLLAWPVTVTTGREQTPCFPVTIPGSTQSLNVWPDVEHAIAPSLVGRRLGIIMDDAAMAKITTTCIHPGGMDTDLDAVCRAAWSWSDLSEAATR